MAGALLAVAAPASAGARPARPAHVRTLELNDDIPGEALPASPFSGSLSAEADADDVFFTPDLHAGQILHVSVTGTGQACWPILYGQDATSIYDSPELIWAEGPSYPLGFDYVIGTTGVYYLDIFCPDGASDYTVTWSVTDAPIVMDRFAGENRYDTAMRISQASFSAGSADSIVLATGENFADALAAAPLAGSYGAPVLLTRRDTLPAGLVDEIDRLRGTNTGRILIVGGTSAVSQAVEDVLMLRGHIIDRIAGDNRYDTAARIAVRVRDHEQSLGHVPRTEVFVVNGKNYPDALSITPYAARMRMPIFLVQPGYLPPQTATGMTDCGATKAFVMGGDTAVSAAVAGQLPVTTRQRIAGDDRFETCKLAADYAISRSWSDASMVMLATGRKYPDALGGGTTLGLHVNGVLLLTEPESLPAIDSDFIWSHRTEIGGMRVFGSNESVYDGVFGDFLDSMSS
jgi:putative cell wall-binding protein